MSVATKLDLPGPHGTRTHYNSGCKCDRCSDANYRYQKQYRLGRLAQRIAEAVPFTWGNPATTTPPGALR